MAVYGNFTDTAPWTEDFTSLDFCGGKVRFICEQDEDMITVSLPNGYTVDVGYQEQSGCYYISIAQANDAVWNPETVIPVYIRAQLPNELQAAVYRAAVL